MPETRSWCYLPNCIEYAYAYLAVYSLGLVMVPVDFFMNPNELVAISNHCGVKAIITTKNIRYNIHELKVNIPSLRDIITIEDDPRFVSFWRLMEGQPASIEERKIDPKMPSSIFYTSGSTSRPKGVLWNYDHIHIGSEETKYFLGIDHDTRSIASIPMSHSGGVLFPMMAVKYGASAVLMPQFAPLDYVKLCKKWEVTFTFMVPSMFYAVLNLKDIDKYSIPSLRHAAVFGAPSSYDLMKKFQALFTNCSVINGWGMTEVIPR
jgi:acyl-CoA synthetase (AMP-forming)/AMP-acid ligase II